MINLNKNIKINFLLLILIYIIISCKKEKLTKDTHFLKEIKQINISIPKDTYYMSWNNQVVENDSIVKLLRLRYKRGNGQGINYFDLTNEKFIKSEIYPSEGDNGVGELLGFYYINTDSIILVNRINIFLANHKKDIVNSIKFVNNYKHDYFPISVSNKSPIVYNRGNLYIDKQEYNYHYSNEFYSSKLNLSINLTNSDIVEKQNISFPKKYYDKCWGYSNSIEYRTYNDKDNLFIYSFPIDDNIYIFNSKEDKIIKTISCKSKFINEIYSMNCKYKDNSYRRKKYYLSTPSYDNIIYDKYKNIYYRFVKLPVDDDEIPEIINSRVGNLAKPLVIMILDSSFNILGESKMEKNRFYSSDYFITKEGLWISNNHPENPNFDENTLSFSLFKVEQNEK